MTSQTLPDGRTIGYSYDLAGNVSSITPPGRSAHVFIHDALDRESEYNPPDIGLAVDVTKYLYNLDDDLTQIVRPDGQTIDYVYDTGGRVSSITLPQTPGVPGATIGYVYGAGSCPSCGGVNLPASVMRTKYRWIVGSDQLYV